MTRYDSDTHKQPARSCAVPQCKKEGLYRAPESPDRLSHHIWLCLEHVRLHNARWNYLEGSDPKEIERQIRQSTLWERPTWPFGKGPLTAKNESAKKGRTEPPLPPTVVAALALLTLAPPTSLGAIKARYRVLAKLYHPDTNRGSKAQIEKFHALQQAFGTLQKYYATKQKKPPQ